MFIHFDPLLIVQEGRIRRGQGLNVTPLQFTSRTLDDSSQQSDLPLSLQKKKNSILSDLIIIFFIKEKRTRK